MKVLIADDSEAVRKALKLLLESQGYEVVTQEDGQRAYDTLLRNEVQLAILDWMMPGMDGVDICRQLQALNRLCYLILLTSKTGDENIVAALQAGASDYLTKPFKPAELFARLRVGERIIKLQTMLSQREKLEAIGRLASGIAHEINTPTQFVGDNARFLRDAFNDLNRLLQGYGGLLKKLKEGQAPNGDVQELEALAEEIEVDFLEKEIPLAVQQTLDGVDRVAKIVRAMKEFSHPGGDDHAAPVHVNKSIENAVAVSRSEWKEVADVVTELDPALPLLKGYPGVFNQVVLNIIVNAAQAIGEVSRKGGTKGKISIKTLHDAEKVEVRISDTGPGIPEEVRPKIFDPFFTTKPVGKGTGQGLAIAHSAVVEKHGGSLTFETEVGKGTTFVIRLPLVERVEA